MASSNNVENLAIVGTNCITGMPTGYISSYSSPDFHQSNATKNITAAITSYPKPNVVIVSYANNGYDWLPFDEIMSDLRRIKQYADSAGVRCYITTTQPRNSFSTNERAKLKELADSIIAAFKSFAIDFWTPLALPGNSQNPLYSLADNVHPNAAGHELLFYKVVAKNIFNLSSLVPLPVWDFNLLIKAKNNQTQLTWRSPSADLAPYFNVEKSNDGRLFHTVITVKNNGQSILSYTDDNTKETGKTFYRIAQVDGTGKTQYSKIVNTEIVNNNLHLCGFAEQTDKSDFAFYISSPKNSQVKIALFNGSGNLICQSKNQLNFGSNRIHFVLPVSSGIYYLNISNEDAHLMKRITKL